MEFKVHGHSKIFKANEEGENRESTINQMIPELEFFFLTRGLNTLIQTLVKFLLLQFTLEIAWAPCMIQKNYLT